MLGNQEGNWEEAAVSGGKKTNKNISQTIDNLLLSNHYLHDKKGELKSGHYLTGEEGKAAV